MNSENYWKQFTRTGRIEDYLRYVNEDRRCGEEETRDMGVFRDAGITMRDRDDTEADTCR